MGKGGQVAGEQAHCASCGQARPAADYVAVIYDTTEGGWLAQLCTACYARAAAREQFARGFWDGAYGEAVALGWSHPEDDRTSATYFIYREPTDRWLLEMFAIARPMRRSSRRGAEYRRARGRPAPNQGGPQEG